MRWHNSGVKITDISAAELLKKLRATKSAREPDPYALAVLRHELERRLEQTEPRHTPREAAK